MASRELVCLLWLSIEASRVEISDARVRIWERRRGAASAFRPILGVN